MKKVLSVLIFMSIMVVGYSQGYKIIGESDTTIISETTQYGKTTKIRYLFLKENYENAYHYIVLSSIPYNGLNNSAQNEMNELSKYIIGMQFVKPKKKKQ
ncbi:MAG: hypothetical protein V4547_09605 [Bacteroidota bacterium]